MPRTGGAFEEPLLPIVLVAGLTALLVGLGPAWQAARVRPAEVLRHE